MKALASIILFFVANGIASHAAGVTFPSTPSRTCASPNLRWCIRCETQKQGDGYIHTLFLSRLGERDKVPVWVSARRCDALWSDDSQHIAITDWAGSNVAEIFL